MKALQFGHMQSIVGACVGDAAGSYLEFKGGGDGINAESVAKAMRMPGGGCHNTGPGQITDDGELTLGLWNALREFVDQKNNNGVLESSIKAYAAWFDSIPFDIGMTCSLGFEQLSKTVKKGLTETNIVNAFFNIQKLNFKSEANGALMRATALGTFCASVEDMDIRSVETLAKQDALCSHCSHVCQEVNVVYVLAVMYLLRGYTPAAVLDILTKYVDLHVKEEKVRYWFFTESLSIAELNCNYQGGHVRYGFVMAMYFLRNPNVDYETAIRTVLLKGGDSDTNACIVGGIVACYQPIPAYMWKPVLAFDCTTQEHRRPATYSLRRYVSTKPAV
jgi:ADP-ribosylglycohydrolase